LIYLQLVYVFFLISSMLGQFFLQLLIKTFLCNFPPLLRLYIRILHFVLSCHEGIILHHLVTSNIFFTYSGSRLFFLSFALFSCACNYHKFL
jgi:hypothetical protein